MMNIESVESTMTSNGTAKELIRVSDSTFENISVERTSDDNVIVEARYVDEDDSVKTERFELLEEVYYGLDNKVKERRNVNEDIQDALIAAGYAVVNSDD